LKVSFSPPEKMRTIGSHAGRFSCARYVWAKPSAFFFSLAEALVPTQT
jgi:hypothetical protein